jgi:hypothetical protein
VMANAICRRFLLLQGKSGKFVSMSGSAIYRRMWKRWQLTFVRFVCLYIAVRLGVVIVTMRNGERVRQISDTIGKHNYCSCYTLLDTALPGVGEVVAFLSGFLLKQLRTQRFHLHTMILRLIETKGCYEFIEY